MRQSFENSLQPRIMSPKHFQAASMNAIHASRQPENHLSREPSKNHP
ncbi:hypothetical protein GCWU000324_01951 [Kingella oralis ATCC 51147]|uniref:Uncharacterized protein n=1 Tax=Kingella oralis ATCC 51147 TaxID=629741 RepID=C4GIT0_9NEIS|nr:hypothetical protein GCWU000324_01951 [Kingella oralis ATCC 51147]